MDGKNSVLICVLTLLSFTQGQRTVAQTVGPYNQSIRSQLEGRVEEKYDRDNLSMSGQLDSAEGRFHAGTSQTNLQGGLFRSQNGTLKGKVEDRFGLGHMLRPMEGDGLGKSVRVLSGSRQPAQLETNVNVQEDSLDSVLKSANFSLRKMTPQSDYNALTSTRTDFYSGRRRGNPGFAWGIREWAVPGWGINGWGSLPYDRYSWDYGYGWQTGMDWDSMRMSRDSLRADLRLDPNFYNRSRGVIGGIAPIRPLNMNTSWHIQPLPKMAPLYTDQNVLWDIWYRQVSNALYKNWRNREREPGTATLRITVNKNRTIRAELIRCNTKSAGFKKNLMDAVASLNGSATLTFPNMSRRSVVVFDSEFNSALGATSGAYSDRSGEFEHYRMRR